MIAQSRPTWAAFFMRGYAAHTTRMGRMGRGYAAHTTRQRRSMERLYIGRRYFIRAEYGGGAISYAPNMGRMGRGYAAHTPARDVPWNVSTWGDAISYAPYMGRRYFIRAACAGLSLPRYARRPVLCHIYASATTQGDEVYTGSLLFPPHHSLPILIDKPSSP